MGVRADEAVVATDAKDCPRAGVEDEDASVLERGSIQIYTVL